MEIVLNKELVEKFATASLTGIIAEKAGDQLPKEVKLIFPQTTMGWKRSNGGPDFWIMPEHTVPCIAEDLIRLTTRGVKITVEMRPELDEV